MFEHIILGIIQGVAEWLPVSSEGLIFLIKSNFFHQTVEIETLAQEALFLHLGTLCAAVIYFRKDIETLLRGLFAFKEAPTDVKKILQFLIITTLLSGILGLILLKALASLVKTGQASTKVITLLVGCCLLVTAYLELKANKKGYRHCQDLKLSDSILLGIAQGFAALPGLSRSGLTVSALLLRKLDKTQALRLSFLMSIPIVLAGNIIKGLLDIQNAAFSLEALVGLGLAFIFGLATIHALLKIAEKVNFGYFVLFFAILTIGSTFI